VRLQDRARVAVATEQRLAEQVRGAAAYRTRAAAEAAAWADAEAAKAVAAHQALVNVVAADVGLPVVLASPGQQVVERPAGRIVATATERPASPPAVAVPPVPQVIADNFWANEAVHDSQGVAALRAEWGADAPANLGYLHAYLAHTLDDEAWEEARQLTHFTVPIIRLVTGMGRRLYHTQAMQGDAEMTGHQPTLTGEAWQRGKLQFDELTSKLHAARARNDHLAIRQIDAVRSALGEQLWSGTTEPQGEYRQVLK